MQNKRTGPFWIIAYQQPINRCQKKIEVCNSKVRIAAIGTTLDKLEREMIFPEKLALTNQKLEGVKIPEIPRPTETKKMMRC